MHTSQIAPSPPSPFRRRGYHRPPTRQRESRNLTRQEVVATTVATDVARPTPSTERRDEVSRPPRSLKGGLIARCRNRLKGDSGINKPRAIAQAAVLAALAHPCGAELSTRNIRELRVVSNGRWSGTDDVLEVMSRVGEILGITTQKARRHLAAWTLQTLMHLAPRRPRGWMNRGISLMELIPVSEREVANG